MSDLKRRHSEHYQKLRRAQDQWNFRVTKHRNLATALDAAWEEVKAARSQQDLHRNGTVINPREKRGGGAGAGSAAGGGGSNKGAAGAAMACPEQECGKQTDLVTGGATARVVTLTTLATLAPLGRAELALE